MPVHVYCFDWTVYTERIMPAFTRWLIEGDEKAVYKLFAKTRCAQEEQFLPEPMQRLRLWPRAKAFVDTMPRGPHSRKEYARLCSAEQFTALSDRYLHSYTPHLYQNSAALRAIWGAIIEQYCLPWFPATGAIHENANEEGSAAMALDTALNDEDMRGELVSLLQSAGLPELASEVSEQTSGTKRFDWEPTGDDERSDTPTHASQSSLTLPDIADIAYEEENDREDQDDYDIYADEEEETRPTGTLIGSHPNTLHMRGWLASYSVRAMALFEFLALGRRRMPFGYEPGEPFGCYSGYLTTDEAWQLATTLRDALPPGQSEAEADYKRFCQQQMEKSEHMRLPDEVQPTYAHNFLQMVRRAALYNLGLICGVE